MRQHSGSSGRHSSIMLGASYQRRKRNSGPRDATAVLKLRMRCSLSSRMKIVRRSMAALHGLRLLLRGRRGFDAGGGGFLGFFFGFDLCDTSLKGVHEVDDLADLLLLDNHRSGALDLGLDQFHDRVVVAVGELRGIEIAGGTFDELDRERELFLADLRVFVL